MADQFRHKVPLPMIFVSRSGALYGFSGSPSWMALMAPINQELVLYSYRYRIYFVWRKSLLMISIKFWEHTVFFFLLAHLIVEYLSQETAKRPFRSSSRLQHILPF